MKLINALAIAACIGGAAAKSGLNVEGAKPEDLEVRKKNMDTSWVDCM